MQKTVFAVLIAAALPIAAHAAPSPNYSYVEGGYSATTLSNTGPFNLDSKGWGFDGSAAMGDRFNLLGGYSRQKTNDFGLHFDDWNLGLGFHTPVHAGLDFVATLAYRRINADFGVSANGWDGDVGLRGTAGDHFEGWAAVGYEHVASGGNGGTAYGKLGAQIKVNAHWGIVGEVRFLKNESDWFVGPRFSF